ncbi:MAG: adenosylmethionine--8-amino-7-oxononanoate transaminase [Chitinophagaceae bacterium]|nr:adenosylmethionine--8-amino-7-oxononanoate transaminase [Chitinophagaceae bacterium]
MVKNLQQRDQQVIWHPFTPQKNMMPPIPIVKAKGTLLFSEDGQEYIDAISSWWVTLHGHAHPYIAEQLYRQAQTLEQVIFAGFTHEPAVSLAEKLLPLLPGNMARIFYSDNGSTSTEVALKMAIQFWWNKGATKRNKIVAFNNSYHGDTFGAMSVSDRSVFTLAFTDKLFEVIFIDTPATDNIQELIKTIEQEASTIAAFIYEPLVQGAGGLKMYEPLLLDQLLKTMKAHNIVCIADEVMTGFGRTGKLFAGEYLSEKPDIICLSKGLTGGTMALGVTACNQKIYDAYLSDDKLKTFFHGHSFTANPLACTAALASLHLLLQNETKQSIARITRLNKIFSEELMQLKGIKNLRQLGTILAFEISSGKDEYLNNISATITSKMLKKGVYLRPLGNTVYLMPPYCITDLEYEKVKIALLETLENI